MPSPRVAPGTVIADEYKVLRPIAEKDFACVYVAEQASTGAQRALKLLDPQVAFDVEVRARFERVARVGADIESEHVVVVYGAGVDGPTGSPWIAMELVDGEDLAQRVAHRRGLSPAELLPVLDAVCDALGAAHLVGIVHGDLRPQNVLLGASTKVADFGLSQLAHAAKIELPDPPLFAAPETLDGADPTPAADVWALGLIAFFALTERSYWRAANTARVSNAALVLEMTDEPIEAASARAQALGSPVSLSGAFDAWFAKCVARDPSARFADGDAARAALKKALDEGPARPRFAEKGTMVLGDAAVKEAQAAVVAAKAAQPKPMTGATMAVGDEQAWPALQQVAQAKAAAEAEAKKKKGAAREQTMSIGAAAAPGFTAEEIIQRDLGRAPRVVDDAPAVPSPRTTDPTFPAPPAREAPAAFSEALPPPPQIPMPRARPAAAEPPPRARGGSSWIFIALGVVAVMGLAAFAAVRFLARPVGPAAVTPDDSAQRAAAEEASARAAQEEQARRAQEEQRDAEAVQAATTIASQTPAVPFDATTFPMGSAAGGGADERPVHDVELKAYALDAHEVTAEAYAACVKAGRCTRAGSGDGCTVGDDAKKQHPANCVDHAQAAAFCEWAFGRLPSEAEWEYAATGAKKFAGARRYPWGDAAPIDPNAAPPGAPAPQPQLCWSRCGSGGGTCAVQSFPSGKTPQGLYDMAGGVAEWTDSAYCPYSTTTGGPCGSSDFVVRGGAWCGSDANAVRGTARQAQPATVSSPRVGFRCAHQK